MGYTPSVELVDKKHKNVYVYVEYTYFYVQVMKKKNLYILYHRESRENRELIPRKKEN